MFVYLCIKDSKIKNTRKVEVKITYSPDMADSTLPDNRTVSYYYTFKSLHKQLYSMWPNLTNVFKLENCVHSLPEGKLRNAEMVSALFTEKPPFL